MAKNKKKELGVEAAMQLLSMIDAFEATGKGNSNRKRFRDVLDFAVKKHAIPREALTGQYGFSKESTREFFAGAAAPVTETNRKTLLADMRTKATAVINAAAPKAAAA